jgi:hypothetical protein
MQYDQGSGFTVYAFEKEPLYVEFIALVRGFGLHMELLSNAQREAAKERFQKALNNPRLTNQLFGSSQAKTTKL